MINRDDLRATLTTLKETSWSWTSAEAPQVIERLGWQVIEVIDDDGIVVTPQWGLSRDEVNVPFRNGEVDRIIMRITDVASDRSAELSTLQDAFSEAVSTAKDLLGPPSEQKVGEQPEVRWRNSTSTISIANTRLAVSLAWAQNDFQDKLDSLKA
ncbi:DUF6301 family protein [Couchioplanes caeruleus]|uniref:Uncharacterized protein n=1 Tax=Couchioplanes caeruleus subsp. caeruleus TaxID=56427 RepID=A0A1K0FQ56_9ACTN|nr:DUF6301 family protein [Couchioplanes caeruleus]OJF14973.1 hypothetical protein BG844_06975 [Couchioplanes caeruleus subsp. caeruleus]